MINRAADGLDVAANSVPQEPSIATVAGYAGVGAFYFLASAIWLTIALSRRSMDPIS